MTDHGEPAKYKVTYFPEAENILNDWLQIASLRGIYEDYKVEILSSILRPGGPGEAISPTEKGRLSLNVQMLK